VPPYVVFGDATLLAMAREKPCSPSELLAISGVGQKKLERYGTVFLQAIAAEADSSGTSDD
jgi:ATP-dependent DNA helicase RecQ